MPVSTKMLGTILKYSSQSLVLSRMASLLKNSAASFSRRSSSWTFCEEHSKLARISGNLLLLCSLSLLAVLSSEMVLRNLWKDLFMSSGRIFSWVSLESWLKCQAMVRQANTFRKSRSLSLEALIAILLHCQNYHLETGCCCDIILRDEICCICPVEELKYWIWERGVKWPFYQKTFMV